MRIAFTHNLRLTDSEDEAEFDSAETVDAIAAALRAGGHEVEKIEVTGPASRLAERLEAFDPDLIFNTAEGRRGRVREAFYPALFEELGFPYTGSDAYVLTRHARQVADQAGAGAARDRHAARRAWSRPTNFDALREPGTLGLALPGDRQAELRGLVEGHRRRRGRARRARAGRGAAARRCAPTRRRAGRGVHRRHRRHGPLPRGRRRRRRAAARSTTWSIRRRRSRFNIYDYRLKPPSSSKVAGALPARPAARRRGAAARDLARWRCARSASATSAASTSGSARTAASTSSRSTRCRRWSRAPASSPRRRARGWTTTRDAAARSSRARRARQGLVVEAGRAPAPAGRPAARRLHLQRQARRPQGRATTPRPSTTRPRRSRRSATRSPSYGPRRRCLEATPSCRGS